MGGGYCGRSGGWRRRGQKRETPMARRQYCSCFLVSRSGTFAPAGAQPSGQVVLRLFRIFVATFFALGCRNRLFWSLRNRIPAGAAKEFTELHLLLHWPLSGKCIISSEFADFRQLIRMTYFCDISPLS